ncbi:MAG: hypothetical protein A2087_05100 [Spirochaetes bacterium GWD1_61_31]|nr:MAG: hypothetical protein A2Y37_14570 [Spirochaetes bacterium GWB1_60_80]OHD32575.1 MAG: hypothetical protein A2004_06130 [Spirochaetes bacterium GWC1_61_12]OHD34804.1 MAG: hypothetical protein A2087_05100 [Spirochaetes bacterium GWD1_61_31]OHD44569.1 MAG: hypothetical protein A2Y35_05410 [Spirochaetes bacterium GWE1_60_18]OHD58642.1 MAG: hypothetical protein A2Y32_03200 [Spirochaetes bacterium GWF1_60_12]HAP43227.1 hypothetical protein [Spirochaetaceae bacterium]
MEALKAVAMKFWIRNGLKKILVTLGMLLLIGLIMAARADEYLAIVRSLLDESMRAVLILVVIVAASVLATLAGQILLLIEIQSGGGVQVADGPVQDKVYVGGRAFLQDRCFLLVADLRYRVGADDFRQVQASCPVRLYKFRFSPLHLVLVTGG